MFGKKEKETKEDKSLKVFEIQSTMVTPENTFVMPANGKAIGLGVQKAPFKKTGSTSREGESEIRTTQTVYYCVPKE